MSVVRRAGFVAALAVLGAVAWKIASREAEQEAPKRPSTPAAAAPAVAPPAVAKPAPPPPSGPRSEPGVIEGRLHETETGRVVEGVRVRAVPEVAGASVESTPWVATGPTGAFRFAGCLDAPHRIVAWAGPLSAETEIAQDARPGTAALELPWPGPTGRQRKGRPAPSTPLHRIHVEGPGGEPVHRAALLVHAGTTFGALFQVVDGSYVRDPSIETWATQYEVLGASDGAGAPLPYGPASLTAEKAGSALEVTVRLPAEKVLEGRLTGPDGAGVPQIDLRAVPVVGAPPDPTAPLDHATGRTAEDGSFRLTRLGDLEYRIVPVGLPWSMTPKGTWKARPTGTPIELSTSPAVEIELSILDPDGAPVAGATLDIQREGEPEPMRRPGLAPTSVEGKVTLHAMDPQSLYRWTATAPPHLKTLAPLVVHSWKPVAGTHSLPRGFEVRGTLRSASGEGTSGMVMRKLPDGTYLPVTLALPDGSFDAGSLPEGDVTLVAYARPGAAYGPEVTVKTGTKDVILTLP